MTTLDENPDGVNRRVRADEIRWTLEPLPRVESVNLLTLTDDETLVYARTMQAEITLMRGLLHDAVATVARLTAQLKRSTTTVRELRRAA